MSPLAGKRILVIGIGFYDYEQCLVERLRQLGAVVELYMDRPKSMRVGLVAAARRFLGWRGTRLLRRHESSILRSACGFDFVLVIKGTGLRPEFLQQLRHKHAGARFILYLWDSLARLPGIEQRLGYFDRVLTFDRLDAEANPAFVFRPLFFRADPGASDQVAHAVQQFGVCFVGWLHADRLRMVRGLQASARAQNIPMFVYLYTGLYTWIKLAFTGKARNVHFRTLAYADVLAVMRKCAAVLDLPHSEQSGMTMRAIEAIGMEKKLITTARDAMNYDFATEGRVAIIGGDDPEIDREFIAAPAPPLGPERRTRYSLDAWIGEVFAA